MNNYNPEGSTWFRGALVVIALLFAYSIVTDDRQEVRNVSDHQAQKKIVHEAHFMQRLRDLARLRFGMFWKI